MRLGRHARTSTGHRPRRRHAPARPVDGREIRRVEETLLGPGGFTPDTIFSWVQLQEPLKEEVLAFRPGVPLHRQAFVVALSPAKKTAFEIVADLTANRIVSTKDLQNLQLYLAGSEFDRATQIINGSADVRAALERRGLKLEGENFSAVLGRPLRAG